MGLRNNNCKFDIFRKKSKSSHFLELKKLENDILDQISPRKSVGVRNRPQMDGFLQSFLRVSSHVCCCSNGRKDKICSFF